MTRSHAFAGIAVAVAAVVFASPAAASCIRMTPDQQRARADVIFDGVALDGATTTGIERFRVLRYLKGRGPAIARVRTGRRAGAGGGGVVTSVSIDAARGETWRIFGQRLRSGVISTTVCDGSRRIRPRRSTQTLSAAFASIADVVAASSSAAAAAA